MTRSASSSASSSVSPRSTPTKTRRPAPMTPTGLTPTVTFALETRCKRAINAALSGDDVGDQARAQALDLVFEHELALLQPLQLELVLHRIDDEPVDDVVEIVVLDLERVQTLANLGFFLFGQRSIGHAVKKTSCGCGQSYRYTGRGESPSIAP